MPKNGGRRIGAGRPKGSKNKRTSEIARKAADEGVTPLEYMLDILRTPIPPELKKKLEDPKITVDLEMIAALSKWHALRFEAAKYAAPFVHPRLASIEANVTGDQTITVVSNESMPEDDWETNYSDHLAAPARPPESLN